jgi:hypothetical protein
MSICGLRVEGELSLSAEPFPDLIIRPEDQWEDVGDVI